MAFMPRKPVWVGLNNNNNKRPATDAETPDLARLNDAPSTPNNQTRLPSQQPVDTPVGSRPLSAFSLAFHRNEVPSPAGLFAKPGAHTAAKPRSPARLPHDEAPAEIEPEGPSQPKVGLLSMQTAYRIPVVQPVTPVAPQPQPHPPTSGVSLSSISKHLEKSIPPPAVNSTTPNNRHAPDAHLHLHPTSSYRSRYSSLPSSLSTDKSAHLNPLGHLPLLPFPVSFTTTRLFQGHVTEIQGASGSGKTELLRRIAVEFAVPRYLGGKGETVIVIDCENRFDMHRFAGLLKERVEVGWRGRFGNDEGAGGVVVDSPARKATSMMPVPKAGTLKTPKSVPSFAKFMQKIEEEQSAGGENVDPLRMLEKLVEADAEIPDKDVPAENGPDSPPPDLTHRTTGETIRKIYFESLDRILVCTPSNPLSALCTVMGLPATMDKENVGAVLIDAVTSFNHLDTDSIDRLGSGSGSGPSTRPAKEDFAKQLHTQLRAVLDKHPVFVFAATSTSATTGWTSRPVRLAGLANHTISLERSAAPRFDPKVEIGIEEMVRVPTGVMGKIRSGQQEGEGFRFGVSRSEGLEKGDLVY